MKIGEATIKSVAHLIEGLLREHLGRINQGWNNAGEKDFKISLNTTLDANKGGITPTVKISYTIEKVEDSAHETVNELQTSLFDEKGTLRKCYLRPEDEGVFENVCKRCERRVDLLFISGKELPRIIDEDPPELKEGQMLQTYVCPAWSDNFYKEWCFFMAAKEIESKEEPAAKKSVFKKIAGGRK